MVSFRIMINRPKRRRGCSRKSSTRSNKNSVAAATTNSRKVTHSKATANHNSRGTAARLKANMAAAVTAMNNKDTEVKEEATISKVALKVAEEDSGAVGEALRVVQAAQAVRELGQLGHPQLHLQRLRSDCISKSSQDHAASSRSRVVSPALAASAPATRQ